MVREKTRDPAEILFSSLRRLHIGERFWFWCSPDIKNHAIPLLITTLSKDKGMQTIQKAAASVPVSLGGTTCLGTGYVDDRGTLQLAGPLVEQRMLVAISQWVHQHIAQHPLLARLKNLRLLHTRRGKIVTVFADDLLWNNIPQEYFPGSMEHAITTLTKLRTGEQAWFLLLEKGPNKRPHLAIQSQKESAHQARFERLINNVLRRSGKKTGLAIKGVIEKKDTWLLMSTSDPSNRWKSLISTILQHFPSAHILQQVRLMTLRKGKIHSITPFTHSATKPAKTDSQKENLRLIEQLLSQKAQEPLFFALGTVGDSTFLLLNSSRKSIMSKLPEGASGVVKGKAHQQNGRFTFVATKEDREFVPRLIKWYKKHVLEHPGLQPLKGAQFAVRPPQNSR